MFLVARVDSCTCIEKGHANIGHTCVNYVRNHYFAIQAQASKTKISTPTHTHKPTYVHNLQPSNGLVLQHHLFVLSSTCISGFPVNVHGKRILQSTCGVVMQTTQAHVRAYRQASLGRKRSACNAVSASGGESLQQMCGTARGLKNATALISLEYIYIYINRYIDIDI